MRKQILLSLLFVFFIFSSIPTAFANDHKVEERIIHVQIHDDGRATIRDTWKAHLTESTELFIPMNDLKVSNFTNYTVQDKGEHFTYVENWDSSLSRHEKMKQYGIIPVNGGVELVWGIGEYGSHEYILEYTVDSFIKQLKDDQMLYWKFVNDQTNLPPEKVTITIEAPKPLTNQHENIWGFGFEGDVHFVDGAIVAESNKPLKTKNHATILVQFQDQTFNTDDYYPKTFEQVKKEAFKGSDYQSDGGFFQKIYTGILALFIGLLLFSRIKSPFSSKRKKKFKKKFPNEYYRELPYEWDLFHLQYYFEKIRAGSPNKLLAALILKWIYEDRIFVETELKGFFKKKPRAILYFTQEEKAFTNKTEQKIYQLFQKRTNKQSQITQNNYKKWPTSVKKSLYYTLKKFEQDSHKYLRDHNYIERVTKGKFIFKSTEISNTAQGTELENNIYKFINYLDDFSLIHEQEAINVKIWDHIMIWAAALGMTDKVREQFEKLYPNYDNETQFHTQTIESIDLFTYYVATTSRSAAVQPRNTGGGGSTSIGGGGGSFGGGSGGGSR